LIGWFDPGYWGLFAASFLAATILPFSSEALFCFMLLKGYDTGACLLIASVGNTLGGLTCYYMGYWAKWEWLEKYFGIARVKTERFANRARTFGPLTALLCWLPFVGDLLAVALGFIRSNVTLVAICMFVGKLGRYAVLACIMHFYYG
jgi:membrane protein YqaA with SNARE-associated domain